MEYTFDGKKKYIRNSKWKKSYQIMNNFELKIDWRLEVDGNNK